VPKKKKVCREKKHETLVRKREAIASQMREKSGKKDLTLGVQTKGKKFRKRSLKKKRFQRLGTCQMKPAIWIAVIQL